MAISLKEQLRIIQEGVHYHAPHVNITKSGDAKTLKNATQLFYDFYAMELMHRQLGSPPPDPDIAPGQGDDPETMKYELTPQQKNKFKMATQFGANPVAAMAVNWADVEFPPMGGTIVPSQLRRVIDQVYDEVVIQISKKLMNHVRLSVIQEFRYIVNYSPEWQQFRHKLVSKYNVKGTISKEEFNTAIKSIIPGMVDHPDAVMRLLKFCKYYSSMHPDPADIIKKSGIDSPSVGAPTPEPEPNVKPKSEPNVKPEPDPTEPLSTPGDKEPDDTDYDVPPVEVPPGAEWDDDEWKYKLEEMIDWLNARKTLTEAASANKFLLCEMAPKTISAIMIAIRKSGLTWEDIALSYNNLNWGGGSFGGPKWGEGAKAFIKLAAHSKFHSIEEMASVVDHIYDLEHNTGELLNKGGMFVNASDLDRRAKMTHLARYLPYVSPLVKRLIVRVLGYVSKHPEIEQNINQVLQSPTSPFPTEAESKMATYKFVKSDNGDEWVTQAPYENKKGSTVQNQYTAKFHKNGMYSVQDSMNADSHVFDTWEEFEDWMQHEVNNFIMPQPGMHDYSFPKPKTDKEIYLESHTKIKLDAEKETKLLEECKMAWRPSNHYYKAYLPMGDRVQFFAFSDGTFMGCLKSEPKKHISVFNNWDAAFEYCKLQTVKALPNDDYAEGKAWIGKKINDPSPISTPTVKTIPGVPSTEYSLGPIEVNMLQILANQTGGTITVIPNVEPSGLTMFVVQLDNHKQFYVLGVGKKAITPTGKSYKVIHSILPESTDEDWSFANWNQTYNFIVSNFASLTQNKTLVKGTVSTSVFPQIFASQSSEPLPPPSVSKATYKAHMGIAKPPTHTIRLTQEDDDLMKSVGFEPKMHGSDVWYIHNKIGDVAKFFPNDVAKILILKGNTGATVTKKIDDALSWLKAKYQNATVSPIVAPNVPSIAASKAGAMFEKVLSDAGFHWIDDGFYFNQTTGETLKIQPYPKSTYKNPTTGESKTFNSLPEMAMFIKKDD